MCLSDLLRALKADGIDVNASQVRYAITSGKVTRPKLDGSLKFDFSTENIAEIAAHFSRDVQHA